MSASDDRDGKAQACRAGLCSAHVTAHSGDCEVRRLLSETTRLVQENERLRIELAAERARRIDAELGRERLREVVGRRPN